MTGRPDYELTGVGEIPAEWDVRPLSDLITRLENGLNYKQTSNKDGIPITRIETISAETIDTERTGLVNGLSDDEVRSRKVQVGDILFSHINSVEHIGKTAIYRGEPPVLIHGMNLLLIRPNTERISPLFLLYCLKHGTTRNRFRSLAKKAVNQASINTAELRAFKLPVPSLAEQDRIVSILSAVDDAIQKTDEVIAKTQQLKKGLMQQLLTRGIGHTKFKQTEIGEIPEEWEVLRLDDILLDVRYGTSVRANIEGRGFPVLGIPNILTGEIDESNLRHVELPESQRKALALGDGDILVVRTNANPEYVGRSALFAKRNGLWLFASYLIRLRFDTARVVPSYLAKLLQTEGVRKSFLQIARTSAGNYNINTQGIRSITVSLPPIEEQKQIVSGLSFVDNRMRNERQRKKELGDLKKGLMQVLLTGKVRVKVD